MIIPKHSVLFTRVDKNVPYCLLETGIYYVNVMSCIKGSLTFLRLMSHSASFHC